MRKKRTEQEWRTLLKQYQSSGLTQRAFCDQQSISLSTFLAKRQRYSQVCADDLPGFVQAQVTQTMRSEKLEFTPAVLKVLEYDRPKYSCRQCEQTQETTSICQKPAPVSLIPKSFATESLLANIILGKYQYALPLYRQETLSSQSGIELSRTTMARWVMKVSEKFMPLYKALKSDLLKQVVIQTDETPLNVLKEEKKCYMWLYCSGADSPEAGLSGVKNIVLFDYQNSRARTCAMDFLGHYQGYLQSDGYYAYDGLENIMNVGCFAHARRKSSWRLKSCKVRGRAAKPTSP